MPDLLDERIQQLQSMSFKVRDELNLTPVRQSFLVDDVQQGALTLYEPHGIAGYYYRGDIVTDRIAYCGQERLFVTTDELCTRFPLPPYTDDVPESRIVTDMVNYFALRESAIMCQLMLKLFPRTGICHNFLSPAFIEAALGCFKNTELEPHCLWVNSEDQMAWETKCKNWKVEKIISAPDVPRGKAILLPLPDEIGAVAIRQDVVMLPEEGGPLPVPTGVCYIETGYLIDGGQQARIFFSSK